MHSHVALRGSRNGLNLQGKIEKWQEVIQELRGGPSREFRKEMQQYDFIEGPLFGAGQSLKNPMPNKGSYQLCVVSLDCAKFFDRHLHSIFFFEPDRWIAFHLIAQILYVMTWTAENRVLLVLYFLERKGETNDGWFCIFIATVMSVLKLIPFCVRKDN